MEKVPLESIPDGMKVFRSNFGILIRFMVTMMVANGRSRAGLTRGGK